MIKNHVTILLFGVLLIIAFWGGWNNMKLNNYA